MNSRNPSVDRLDRVGSIIPSSWKYEGIYATWIAKGEIQYDYLDGNWYKENDKNHKISILH